MEEAQNTAITSFTGEFRFLSNFYLHPVEYEGAVCKSAEHAYQAAKTLDPLEKETVRRLQKPGQAKRAGRLLTLRKDWDEVKLQVMEEILRRKFSTEPLRSWLLETGDAELIEGNTWGDLFWGAVRRDGRWEGRNYLGKLLMFIREELRKEGP